MTTSRDQAGSEGVGQKEASRRQFHLGLIAGLLLLMAALVGCGTVTQVGKEIEVGKAQYASFWAFTLESGTLKCLNATGRRKGEAVCESGGVMYALNETALAAGHAPIDPIVLDHPKVEGIKINYHRYEEMAVAECY